MAISKRKLIGCLEKKFHFEPVAGSRHDAVALFIDGSKVATTRFSRSHEDVSESLLRQIAKQCRVQLGEFKGMYECTVSYDDYIDLLTQQGYIKS